MVHINVHKCSYNLNLDCNRNIHIDEYFHEARVFAQYLGNQVSDFKRFFLKTEIHTQILNTKQFLCNIRRPRYLQTKWDSRLDDSVENLNHLI